MSVTLVKCLNNDVKDWTSSFFSSIAIDCFDVTYSSEEHAHLWNTAGRGWQVAGWAACRTG